MWTIFKASNLFLVLASTYLWMTSLLPRPVLFLGLNVIMLITLGMLPIKIELGIKNGLVLLATVALTVWSTYIDGWGPGLLTIMMYMPAQYLLVLPYEYKKDLLDYVTKWYAIPLAIALGIYWLLFFIDLPSFGRFVHPIYKPFTNYIFYIKTTFDTGAMPRFNAFFLEPGHQALVSTFILMANKFEIKKKPLLLVLVFAVLFSFSLAGYILMITGFLMLKINTLPKLLGAVGVLAGVVIAALVVGGGDNTLNELIISRLEYDESSGIKGNNRFFNDTDYVYDRTLETEYFWTGVKGKANMELISGAGYKIYILNYGMIGSLLALAFYLSLIPSHPARRYTISFLLLIILCFMQRAYPFWYSWIFPYIVGIYVAEGEKEEKEAEEEGNTFIAYDGH